MKIAQNPLSKNLVAMFGKKLNSEFRKKIKFLQEDMEKKELIAEGERNQFSAEGIKNWIQANPEDITMPYKNPSLSNLIKIAQVKNISVWDLFVDPTTYFNLSKLPEEKKKIIQSILTLRPKYIEMISSYINSVFELQEQTNGIDEKNFFNSNENHN